MRRTLGITATAAAISIAAMLPAGAQASPGIDSYTAGSFARAVDLTLGSDLLGPLTDEIGTQISLAHTSSSINDAPKAIASGAAVLVPGLSSVTPEELGLGWSGQVNAATDGETEANSCPTIEGLPPEITTDLVCVKTSANLIDGRPVGNATASEIVLEIKAPSLKIDQLDPLTKQLTAQVDALFIKLEGIAQPVEKAAKVALIDTIRDLIGEVQAGHVLARITVAPSNALSELTSTNVLASAKSNGAVIEVLPDLADGALAVVTVGTSTAQVVRDAVTGEVTANDGAAALVDVQYPNGNLAGLTELTNILAGALGTVTSVLPCDGSGPTGALAGVVCFDVGKPVALDAAEAKAMGFDFGPTTVGQHSSVLDLRVLAAAPGGPVARLQLGETAAAAASTTPLPRPFTPPTPDPLPRTGGDAAMPLTLGLLALGMGGAALVRRSRTI